jgi:pimeloyl-ACP methyl ester carboxylesterase
MSAPSTADPRFSHRQVQVEGLSIHVAEAGTRGHPAVLFLHGWPQCWAAFARVMDTLRDEAHVLALDLPGIGGSTPPPPANDKRTLARYVRGVIAALALTDVTLAGHDAGGQIVYAYLHAYPEELARAVIMNVAVPGLDPWDEVKRNPHIWHFAFHAVPELPEVLVAGHEARYFDFFYGAIAARPEAITPAARAVYAEAYARPEALRTGFEWYRAFAQDEKDNAAAKGQPIDTPVLYLRGDHDSGDLEDYLQGLRDGGLREVQGRRIADCGHFAPDEQPEAVGAALREFVAPGVAADHSLAL